MAKEYFFVAVRDKQNWCKFDTKRKKCYNKDVVSKGGTKNIWRKLKKQNSQLEK